MVLDIAGACPSRAQTHHVLAQLLANVVRESEFALALLDQPPSQRWCHDCATLLQAILQIVQQDVELNSQSRTCAL